jgi:hypothetical protein
VIGRVELAPRGASARSRRHARIDHAGLIRLAAHSDLRLVPRELEHWSMLLMDVYLRLRARAYHRALTRGELAGLAVGAGVRIQRHTRHQINRRWLLQVLRDPRLACPRLKRLASLMSSLPGGIVLGDRAPRHELRDPAGFVKGAADGDDRYRQWHAEEGARYAQISPQKKMPSCNSRAGSNPLSSSQG